METRNLILSIVLSVGVLLLWAIYIEAPNQNINHSIESNQEDSIGEVSELEVEQLDQIEESLGIKKELFETIENSTQSF